jgi:hypothetical protein
MKTKKLSTYQSSRDLAKSLPNHILLFKAGAMVQVFDEDAILLNRLLGYKLNLLGANDQSYLRSGFPLTILDKVVKQIKSDLKLQIAFFQKDSLSQEFILEKEYSFKTRMQKSDYVNHGDLEAAIFEIQSNEKQINKVIVSKNSLRKNDSFHLHTKMLKLFVFISASITRYMPRVYKGSLGQSYLSEWVLAMKQINLLRNIPGYMQDDSRKTVEYKSLIYSKISSSIDLLKDLSETIYRVKGFKNKKSFKFLMLELTELGRLNKRLQEKFSLDSS